MTTTKTILVSYTTFISIALLIVMTGVITAHASEVTGTLSSDASSNSGTEGNIDGTVSNNSQTDGSLAGTVSSETSGSGGGGGGRSSGRGSGENISLSSPPGAVLGETTENLQAPGFPNAGTAPSKNTAPTPWSALITFLKDTLSF